jgi:hypothetical protein
MRWVLAITCLLGLIMTGALVYGFGFGGGWAEVRTLMDYPWFVVSLVDVYVGFILFACWIGVRERLIPALIWIVFLMTLGNLIACIYVLYAIKTHRSPPLAGVGAAA